MNKENIILIGAGGHALSCIDVIEQENKYNIHGLVGLKDEVGKKISGYEVIATQDELVNQPIISIKSLQVLCLIYDINIFFIKNRTIYEIIVNDKPIKTIINDNNNIYMIDDINEEKLTYYRNNYWKIDNISKPLNAFSSYSLTELQDICKKLEIPITTDGKKIQKKDLYQSILTKI